MEKKAIAQYKQMLDDIRHAEDGVEYWLARELMSPLGYERWENFHNAIKRAVVSCVETGITPEDHFRETTKMINIGKGAQRNVIDFMLTRYDCQCRRAKLTAKALRQNMSKVLFGWFSS